MTEVISNEKKVKNHGHAWIDDHFPAGTGINKLKHNALDQFLELGLPSWKSESYKYTPIQKIIEKSFELTAVANDPSWTKEDCQKHFYADENANHLVFINGVFVMDYSTIVSSSDELVVKVINQQTIDEEKALSDLGQLNGAQLDPFAALNLAYFDQGAFLAFQKNKQAKNIYVYHFVGSEDSQLVTYPRLFIKGASGSQGSIFEKTISNRETPYLSIGITEAVCDPNASIRYTKVQNLDKEAHSIEGTYGYQAKDSRFYTNTFSFSGAVIRNNIYINVDDENCEAHMHGLYQLSGKSHVDNNTSVDHLKPHSYSNELYKGIVDERSRAVFNGKIYVRPDAQKTNAFQSNNNIILTDTATVNTKPQLEIWADDVQCSHGCTTGQLDDEAIFYLRSRGIDQRKAKAMMLNAFAAETLKEVQNDLIREELEEQILNKLS